MIKYNKIYDRDMKCIDIHNRFFNFLIIDEYYLISEDHLHRIIRLYRIIFLRYILNFIYIYLKLPHIFVNENKEKAIDSIFDMSRNLDR